MVSAGLSVPDGDLPIGDIVLVLDGDGVVRHANDAARLLFGELVPGRTTRIADLLPTLAGQQTGRRTTHGGLRLDWQRQQLDSGQLVWWGHPVIDDTAPPRRWWTDLGRILEGTLTPDRIAGDLAKLAVPVVGDICVVLLPAALSRFRWWRCAGTDGGVLAQGRISERLVHTAPVLADALDGGTAPQRVAAAELAVMDWLLPSGFGPVADAAVVPVRGPGQATGLLLVATRSDKTRPPRIVDLDVLTEFARQADTALDAAIRFGELATVTSGLESSLLPAALPTVPGLRIAVAYRPAQAGLRVGGDFYDVRVMAESTDVMWALGDACGHGPEAASLAGHVRSCFGALSLVERAPSKLLALLNHAIRPTSGSRFTTAVVGRVQRLAGDAMRLTVGRAGHPPPLVLRADGTVEDLMVPGGLLGVFPDVEFEQAELMLRHDEICLVYSDGVLEARRGGAEGEQFGLDRLREIVAGYRGAGVADLVDGVHGEVMRWLAGRHHDDITLLAFQSARPVGDE